MIKMEFKKEDENYVYNVIGKNVKKYRKLRKMTQAELAEKMEYSLSFVSSIESKKYQSFSLGALWRISLVLDVDMYKLCIDEDAERNNRPLVIKYKCNKCDYETEVPTDLIDMSEFAKRVYPSAKSETPTFKCAKCDGQLHSIEID